MNEPSLHLVVLRCADIERSHAFYTALGLSLVPEQHDGGPRHYSCTMGEVLLELYPLGKGRPTAGARIGLSVSNVREVVAAVRAAQVGEVLGVAEQGLLSAVVQDPDGHKVELNQRS
jgi:lactoylglutathione lyase